MYEWYVVLNKTPGRSAAFYNPSGNLETRFTPKCLWVDKTDAQRFAVRQSELGYPAVVEPITIVCGELPQRLLELVANT